MLFRIAITRIRHSGIQTRASGFVYSRNRISAIFSANAIVGCVRRFDVDGVLFYLRSNGMTMEVMTVAIGTRWPKMQDVALQEFRSG